MAYIAGILGGCYYIGRVNAMKPVWLKDFKPFDDFLLWMTLGIVLGGRLGYVLFYSPGYYLDNPAEIIKVWQGGMAFHGGLLGVAVALVFFARKYRYPLIPLADLCAVAAPIGLFFGRIANFINGELYGRVTDGSFGMVFPHAGSEPRHPSQLYEAVLEGLLLWVVIAVLLRFTRIKSKPGMITGIFVVGYGIARLIVEYFREPDAHLGFVLGQLTMGQLLSLPMVVFGGALMVWAAKRKAAS